MKIFLYLIFISLFLTPSFASDTQYICAEKWPKALPPYHFKPNKCGPDSPLAKIIPNKFGSVDLGEACNNHDRCWMELKELNKYGRCEAIFTKDLIKACNKAERCANLGFGRQCVPNPIEIAACNSMIVPSYTSAATAGVFVLRLKKARDDQKDFENCVKKYGYKKRP